MIGAQPGALASLGAIAIESRAARRAGVDELDLAAQARHASSIAAEALAACGRWVRAVDGAAAGDALWVIEVDAPRVLAVLAAVPALPLVESLPWSVRTVLRVLGVPTLDEPPPAGAGVRVLVGEPLSVANAAPVRVTDEATGYRVAFARRA